MELKTYQKHVIGDLKRYLELLQQSRNYQQAFRDFWDEACAPALGHYQNVTPGVPNLCFKVPTGGGKTFLACNAIRPIFEALPPTKTQVVVWLVPSDAILTQTIKCLKDPKHPYRQKIDVDFQGRVEVYTKDELLNGQNFNATTVSEQLSIMVLSYDSFRGRGKDALKAYKENSNLADFQKLLGEPELKIQQAENSALFQVINQLSPLVIVDESHHARSELSLEMLKNFNPCFVLDLTATPRQGSNIISYVDAVQLKQANMVKLPVIVYNRHDQTEVLTDTIDLRNKLEELAKQEQAQTGRHIRPIALFQAQPHGKEDSTTFEKLRDKLVEIGIPAEQIAIRTAEVNELKNIELMTPTCPIRYIITVNALKEGWDCPFAYILASLANRNSQVDVEQILGRILRLPHTVKHQISALNMSYVLTSSSQFNTTVQGIIKGLNHAGFTNRDYRLAPPQEPEQKQKPAQLELPMPPAAPQSQADFLDFDSQKVGQDLKNRQSQSDSETPSSSPADTMLQQGEQANHEYTRKLEEAADDPTQLNTSQEVQENMNTCKVKPVFEDELTAIKLPQFFVSVPQSLFTEHSQTLLDKEQLGTDFTLKGKEYDIDFNATNDEIAKVDADKETDGTPTCYKLNSLEQESFKKYFNNVPPELHKKRCKDIICGQLEKNNMVSHDDLKIYVNHIVDDMGEDQLVDLENNLQAYARKINLKIQDLLTAHYHGIFMKWKETGKIICKPFFVFPKTIHPTQVSTAYGKSLYDGEDGKMTDIEINLVQELTGLDNVRWWHRNPSQTGFCINGFIKHYPDFIIMTKKGTIIVAETKGEQLKNDDSLAKIELGTVWANAAGPNYRYYMIFKTDDNLPKGSLSLKHFIEILLEL